MSDSIDAAELGPAPDARRDRWGRYLVVPPAGGQPEPYTRVTTIAKALDDGGGLADWRAAMALTGLMRNRGLRARLEALMVESAGDPWYGSAEGKAQIKALVTECANLGGANTRRDQGTALHAITAVADAGGPLENLSDETARELEVYRAGLAAGGVHVLADMIEVTVVLDRWPAAGTFDRLVRIEGRELPLIADLKTGANLDYSWGPFACQLAAYARADAIYVQGPAADGSADERRPMPAVDQGSGLIIWLHDGELELHLVDLAAGWAAFEHSIWARSWRKAKPAVPLSDAQSHAGIRTWLQGRIDAVGAHEQARADLRASWPADLPTLRQKPDHSELELSVIEKLLDVIEGRWRFPFPGPQPDLEARASASVLRLFPGATQEPTKQPESE